MPVGLKRSDTATGIELRSTDSRERLSQQFGEGLDGLLRSWNRSAVVGTHRGRSSTTSFERQVPARLSGAAGKYIGPSAAKNAGLRMTGHVSCVLPVALS
jgi:hypothetical protein